MLTIADLLTEAGEAFVVANPGMHGWKHGLAMPNQAHSYTIVLSPAQHRYLVMSDPTELEQTLKQIPVKVGFGDEALEIQHIVQHGIQGSYFKIERRDDVPQQEENYGTQAPYWPSEN